MNKITIGISSVSVLLLGVFVGGIVVYAQAVTREGESIIGRMSYVEVATNLGEPVCTQSDAFEDIPGMTKTFTQGGLLSNEVVVSFSGQILLQGGLAHNIRLLVDGVVQPGTGQELTVSDQAQPSFIGGWNFVTAPLAPGNHTVKLQWQRNEYVEGDQWCLASRSMIIQHR